MLLLRSSATPVCATQCNTLQRNSTHCNTLMQHTATHCNTLKHTVAHCIKGFPLRCAVVQHAFLLEYCVAVWCHSGSGSLPTFAAHYYIFVCCSVLQCVAICNNVCYSVLQCVSGCCGMLQCVVVFCSVAVLLCCRVGIVVQMCVYIIQRRKERRQIDM